MKELTAGLSNVLESLHGGDGFSDIRTETESGLQLIAASSPVSCLAGELPLFSADWLNAPQETLPKELHSLQL